MNLTKTAETATSITLSWAPVPGAAGYRFQSSSSAPKWSHTFDPTRTSVKFSKAQWYKVEALGVTETGQYPSGPTPGQLPAQITIGGTYSGTRVGGVQVRTSQPVLIDNARIERNDAGPLLDMDYAGANVTVRRTVFQGGIGLAVYAQNFQVLDIQNCDILKTWGIRPGTGRAQFVCKISRNRFRNQQYVVGQSPYNVSHPIQVVECNQPQAAEIAWNEFINEFGKSQCEDVISVYLSNGFKVHDNFIRGAYPATHSDRYSGGGILVDSGGGRDNVIADNVCVQTMNYTFAIASGEHNNLHRNRGFCTSKDDNGVPFTNLASGGNGMVVWPQPTTGPGNFAIENTLGILMPGGGRNDWWAPGAENDIEAENTHFSGSINEALFQAEHQRWKDRAAANGITIGA